MRPRSTCIALWLAAMTASCDQAPPAQDVVARVGDAVLTEADLAARPPVGFEPEHGAGHRAQLVETWVERQLLYQEALRRKIDQEAGVQALLDRSRRDLLVAWMLDREFTGQETQVDEDAIRAYYDEHAAEFQRTRPEVRIHHILLGTRRDANARYQALQRGESFEALAREHSLDPDTRFQGGDLGYFSEDQDPVLWEACEDLALGRTSRPVRTEYGYHLIQVVDRQEAGTVRGIDQVRGEIVEDLVRQRQRQRLESLLERLKASHRWSIANPDLPDSPAAAPR